MSVKMPPPYDNSANNELKDATAVLMAAVGKVSADNIVLIQKCTEKDTKILSLENQLESAQREITSLGNKVAETVSSLRETENNLSAERIMCLNLKDKIKERDTAILGRDAIISEMRSGNSSLTGQILQLRETIKQLEAEKNGISADLKSAREDVQVKLGAIRYLEQELKDARAKPTSPTNGVKLITICSGDFIHISKIEALGADGVDYARTGIASQSSTYGGDVGKHGPNVPINGDDRTFNHTDGGRAWWQLEFTDSRPIKKIVIHNRGDGACQERLERAILSVTGNGVNKIVGLTRERVQTINI